MTVKFNVKLSSEDMYRFNMYHAYTSMQGILSLVMGIFVIVVIALSENLHDIRHALPYLLIALIFLLYVPLTLRIRSKRQIHMSNAYIIPKAQVTEELPQIYAMLRQHCKDYRLHIKGEK